MNMGGRASTQAPVRAGRHPDGRATGGHSVLVGPGGEVLACPAAGEGMAMAEVAPLRQLDQRRRFPVLTHRRDA